MYSLSPERTDPEPIVRLALGHRGRMPGRLERLGVRWDQDGQTYSILLRQRTWSKGLGLIVVMPAALP
jgi:hypothetical protein